MDWGLLPNDIIRKIIEYSNPSIDVQLAFKIPPKRLDETRALRLWYLLKSHDGFVYNMDTETLHILRIPGWHIVWTSVPLTYHTAGLTIFNEEEKEHTVTYTCPCGSFYGTTRNDRWDTRFRILFKRAKPSRELTVADALVFGDLQAVS